ncbi:class I SAM-dependent rRNA methyltransferase [Desulfosarcina sp.]|uniref:class I SAM-dependent rRNA methyltransferase n=1 Tax=Desulfosarcina sp. TaxID=2027861 RepID=UPI003970B2C6
MRSMILKPKRGKSLQNRHPWVFSGAIARMDDAPEPGETIDVLDSDGRWLARGAFSPQSQIRVRVWSFDPAIIIDAGFFHTRLNQALSLRREVLAGADTDALRLVNAESDGLPGLIVDRYENWVVCQFLSAGSDRWKPAIVACLAELIPDLAGIYERSDVDVRKKEGLPMAAGRLWGQEPPDQVEIRENGCLYRVNVKKGHKTGFYLDQRDNRACVAAYARGAAMLNCFAYTGGFAVAALKAGAAHVTNVDSSAAVLKLARANVALNRLEETRVDDITADVFSLLRRYRAEGRAFDMIVLDPPKFVKSKGDLMRASRGYKEINRLAFELLHPGGTLWTFSCSGLMGRDLFQKIVADAALDAGRQAVILRWLSQALDHPTALNFPEGSYLKGLVCRVD